MPVKNGPFPVKSIYWAVRERYMGTSPGGWRHL